MAASLTPGLSVSFLASASGSTLCMQDVIHEPGAYVAWNGTFGFQTIFPTDTQLSAMWLIGLMYVGPEWYGLWKLKSPASTAFRHSFGSRLFVFSISAFERLSEEKIWYA